MFPPLQLVFHVLGLAGVHLQQATAKCGFHVALVLNQPAIDNSAWLWPLTEGATLRAARQGV